MRLWVILLVATACYSQDFTQRGFIETRLFLYPQTVPADSGRAIDELYLEYEFSKKISTGLRIYGAFEAQTDTHHQTERTFDFSWLDRKIRRPLFGVRRLSASYTKGLLNIELGKQSVRWGKADILNPTDRFTPRDFLNVFHTDYLSITGSRLIYGGQSNTIDLVFVPFFTPSRAPLLNQRWANLPQTLPLNDLGARYPGGTQFGGRFNHIGKVAEWSISYFDGYNHLPLIDYAFTPPLPPRLDVQRFYPRIRSYGADAAIPMRLFTLKSEAAYITTNGNQADGYLLYVMQLERQSGEWSFVGGYAGQVVTRATSTPDFDPDRGIARSFVGRVAYTIDANRHVALETAIRQNGKGVLVKPEYSQAIGQHWRATFGVVVIRGSDADFIGHFRRNSFASFALRYSF